MPSDDDDEFGEGGSGEDSEVEEVTQEQKDLMLLEACKVGDVKEAKRCVKDGSVATAVAPDGWTPLLWAACNGHVACVQYLLDQGAGQQYVRRGVPQTVARDSMKPKAMDKNDTVNSPLHWAAFKGYLRIVWILLKAKFSPYDIDACGNTSLHLAATGGSVDVLKCLMSEGFDLSVRNWYGNTSLDLADKPETRELLQKATRQKECYASGTGFSAAVLRYFCTHSGRFYCEAETVSDQVVIEVGKADTKPVRYCKESLRVIMGIEKNLTEACKGKLDKSHLEGLRRSVNEADANGCNALLVHKGRRTLARLVAECNLRAEMERLESIRPLKKRGDVKGLVKLIRVGRKEGVRDEDGMEEADGILAALEAEVTLSGAFSMFEGVECASNQHSKELHKLDMAMEEAEACGSHPGFVGEVKAVQNRLHAELDLGNVVAAPSEEAIVDEEGEPTDFVKYEMWDGTVFKTDVPGTSVKFWEFRFNFLLGAIERGTECGAFASLLEKAQALEPEWAETVKEEQAKEVERLEEEEKARLKAEKKAKKGKKKKK